MTRGDRLRLGLLVAAAFGAGAFAGALVYRQLRIHDAQLLANRAPPARVVIAPEHLGKLSLFLLAGQSNMSGRAPMPAPPPAALPSVYVYGNDGHFREGREPVDFAEGQIDEVSADPGAGFGPSIAFAEALQKRRPGLAIGLVPCARGGSAISEWAPSRDPNTLYGSCLSRALAASAQGKIAGVLFFQGEADAADPEMAGRVALTPEAWASAFSAMIGAFRGDLRDPALPVVFAELGKTPDGGAFVGWERVKTQQRSVSLPGVGRIHTDDLELYDTLHFTTESYRAIGGRFAAAMDSILPPP